MPVKSPKKDVGWVKTAPQKRCGTCAHVIFVESADPYKSPKAKCGKHGFNTGANAICNFYEEVKK